MNDQRLEVRLAVDSDLEGWNRFVVTQPTASLEFLFEWKRILERSYRKRCRYLIAVAADRVVGVAPFVLEKSVLGRKRLISLPFLDQGGFLAESEHVATALWRYCCDLAERERVQGIDLRGAIPRELEKPSETERFRWLLELTSSEDQLWAAIGPKVRNQIRKSTRQRLQSRPVDQSRLPDFYRVFSANMLDLGSPVHAISLFSETLEALGTRAKLFLTTGSEGEVVAGAIAIRFGDVVTVPWASSSRHARASCPNHSLYWSIFRDALACGATTFDFGRSSVGTGPFRFKKQWRGQALPLLWASYDLEGQLCQRLALSAQTHPTLVRLWKLLPPPLARWIGPKVRGRISN